MIKIYSNLLLKPDVLYCTITIFLINILLSCNNSNIKQNDFDIIFVRQGIVINYKKNFEAKTLESISLKENDAKVAFEKEIWGSRNVFLKTNWKKGSLYTLEIQNKKITQRSPQAPTPYLHKIQKLNSNLNQNNFDTSLVFSKDGTLLVIGSANGEITLIDTRKSTVVWKKVISEAMIKEIVFSNDSKNIYIGEQSVDAYIYSLKASDGNVLWKFPMSKFVEQSNDNVEDPYSQYSLPGVYQIKALPNGKILALATHSWDSRDGRKNKSQGTVFTENGSIEYTIFNELAINAIITSSAISEDGKLIAFIPSISSSIQSTVYNKDASIEINNLYIYDLLNAKLILKHYIQPLNPYFKNIYVWKSISFSKDSKILTVGLGDGRALILNLSAYTKTTKTEHTKETRLSLAEPIKIGDIPIYAPVSYVSAGDNLLLFQTTSTNIPIDLNYKNSTPKAPHPNSNTLFAYDNSAKLLWKYQDSFEMTGLLKSPLDNFAMVSTSKKIGDTSSLTNGILLLTLKDHLKNHSNNNQILYHYPVSGDVFFQSAISEDEKWIAFTETPTTDSVSKSKNGQYQVHLIH